MTILSVLVLEALVVIVGLARDDEYGEAVREYAADNELWLKEFAAAYIKMTEYMAPCKYLKTPLSIPVDDKGLPTYKDYHIQLKHANDKCLSFDACSVLLP